MTKSFSVYQKNLQSILREEFGKRTIESVSMPSYFATALNPVMQLRPYQEECFRYFFTYWEQYEEKETLPHLLFHMATGSGKTLIMAGLMLYLFDKGYRNFLFFVNYTNIIEKTKENFINPGSAKYLFAPQIYIGQKQVEIKLVDNFQNSDDNCINLCLNTTQGLHTSLNNPKENALTYDDFSKYSIVMISDEAHHINTATKKMKKQEDLPRFSFFDNDGFETEDWESTVLRIFHTTNDSNLPNVLLEFTATADLDNPNIAQKYENKIIFDYPLKRFREDGFSKDIEVVQSDLLPIERVIQAIVLSQYKRKLFSEIGQDIKPVIMLKSRTIADNKKFYELFIQTIKHLTVEHLFKIKGSAKGDIGGAFSYFQEKNISLENLLLELKEDFKEANLLLVDGNTISPEKQIYLNTLEAKNNEYRVVFAVDMLNEGWDVLNLFDIVRLYDLRDAKNGKPGKTTMQEAQLIGRGARYMPFRDPLSEKPIYKRKYDNDITNRLRVVEKLHYHSSHNPRYVQELHTALVETGIVARKTKELNLFLKESFKTSQLYKKGYVFVNKQEKYLLNQDVVSLNEQILSRNFRIELKSGEIKTSLVFSNDVSSSVPAKKILNLRMRDLGSHIIRSAVNRFSSYRYSVLSRNFPKLSSVKEFIESDSYLANLSITVYSKYERLSELSQKEKLYIAMEVLHEIEPNLSNEGIAYRGTFLFEPRAIKDVFKDHVLKVVDDDSIDKEFGKSMREASNLFLTMDLQKCEWHAYNDCFGTSEEKYFIKYLESIYLKLKEKYQNIYLLRNEKDLKLYSFKSGNAFEPDYVLFLQKSENESIYDNIQIFIEPKGEHLKKTDFWKEDCLLAIREYADIRFSTKNERFNVWGMPFFAESSQVYFDQFFRKELDV